MGRNRSRVDSTFLRAEHAVISALPRSAKLKRKATNEPDIIVNGEPIEIKWIGEGNLGDVKRFLSTRRRRVPTIVAARRMSPGARDSLARLGVGWVDETGAAEISIGQILVSRSGNPQQVEKPARWTPAALAIAEALLVGVKPTISEVQAVTGLSTGSCTQALRTIADLGFLEADARRGRYSARRVTNSDLLLAAYASAAEALPKAISLQVGVVWRDMLVGLREVGKKWSHAKLSWASTGAAAASLIAPYLTSVSSAEVYVDADTLMGLESVAAAASLRPISGGRLTLKPFPTASVRRMSTSSDGVHVAPWPRVYVDLRATGVRGEEAAEHLKEVIHGEL